MVVVVVDGGGGGFFLACEDFGGRLPFDPRLRYFFFLKWRLVRAYEFHSLYQDQSTVARRAEMTAAEYSLTSYV